jgi:putative ABC transport system permease protein
MSAIDDVHSAVRTLTRNRAFTLLIVATIGIGVAINLTILTMAEATLFRAAPGVRARDVVSVLGTTRDGDVGSAAFLDFVDYREQSTAFESLAAWKWRNADVTIDGDSTRIGAMLVSAGYFELLGLTAARGRFFRPEEDRVPEEHPVTVLSHAFWRTRYGGEDVLGREILINNRAFRIIGVAPEGFRGTTITDRADLFVPMMMQPLMMPSSGNLLGNRGWSGILVVGRLRRGVDVRAAQADLSAIASRLARAYPNFNEGRGVRLVPLSQSALPPSMRVVARRATTVLLLVGACLLLLVCANVGNLLLARSVRRSRETALRLVLGAGRRGVLRQFATESLLLASAGALAGLALCEGALRILRSAVPMLSPVTIGEAALVAVPVLALLVGLICAIAPMLASSEVQLQNSLRAGTTTTSRAAHRLGAGVVVVQVALSVVLLGGAGLFVRSLQKLREVALGFEAERVLATPLDLSTRTDPERVNAYYDTVLARVRALPGVSGAALGSQIPLSGNEDGTSARPVERPPDSAIQVGMQIVTPGYFDTLGVVLHRGRDFTNADRGPLRICIVNAALARRFWPDADPIGRRIRGSGQELEVVGVVADSRFGAVREEAQPMLFLAHAQSASFDLARAMNLFVRGDSESGALMRDVRALLRSIDPTVPMLEMATLATLRDKASQQERTLTIVLVAMSALAVLLSILGIYGVLSLSVAQRTRELGLRIALGASATEVVRGTVRRAILLAGAGALIGSLLLAGASGAIRPFLYGTTPADPLVWLAVAAAILLATVGGSSLPAWRAGHVDPAVALKDQ